MTQLDRLLRAEAWDEVRRRLVALRPFDVAEELTRLDGTDRALAFRLLPKDLAIEVFEALDPPVQGELLEGLRDESVRMFVAELAPDDRVELLDELPAKVVAKLLAALSPHERRLTTELLGYPPDAVGPDDEPGVRGVEGRHDRRRRRWSGYAGSAPPPRPSTPCR